MNTIEEKLTKAVQNHPVLAVVTVTVAGYVVGTLAGHYLAKGLLKATSRTPIL